MKASEIIAMIQEAIDEHGDQDIVFEKDGLGYDPHHYVDFSNVDNGVIDDEDTPNCFVININN